MALSRFAKRSGSNLTNAAVSTFLLANAFVWYLSSLEFLQSNSSDSLFILALNFTAFIVSVFIGISLIGRFKKRTVFIKYWMLSGLAISLLFVILNLTNFASVILLAGVLGTYFGLGMPTFVGFFAASTESKNRAKFGGLIILLIVLGYPAITLIGLSSAYLTTGILATLSTIGLACLIYFKPDEKKAEQKNQVSYRTVFSNKTFLLYLIPWLMFSLINDLASQYVKDSFIGLLPGYYIIFGNVLAGVCAMVWGFLADKKGRKRLALIGFALLGTGYAALGLSSGAYLAAWFYVCVDGIAWGAFTMLFITTLWGDIAQEKNSEKYYVIGLLPYLFSNFAGASMGAFLSDALIESSTVFSFAAFFLFAATLPLFYAPETLPEKIMKDHDLKSYIENAKKKAAKDVGKVHKKDKNENPKTSEPVEKDANYEEAKKLAEKYY